jgi:flagellar basal body rod protein FlgB
MTTTHRGHLSPPPPNRGEAGLLLCRRSQTNLDRNTVDMDRERASFADNTVKYEATLRFINGSVRTMLDAIKGQSKQRADPGPKEVAMSMFKIFNVSGSAVSAQSQRLNVVASNLANADTVAGPDGKAYKARQVVFQTELMGDRPRRRGARVHGQRKPDAAGRRVHDPKHPAPTPRAT